MRSFILSALLSAITILLFSCSESSTEPSVDLSKFIFNSSDNWLKTGEEGIVFISDTEGNILAYSEWTGNATIELKKTDGTDLPVRLNFTTIRIDTSGNVHIGSDLNLITKTWTNRGTFYPGYRNYVGEVQLNFSNVPTHDWFSVGSAFRTRWGSNLPSTSFDVYLNPDNFFITLSIPGSGKMYNWLADAHVGNTYDVDLSNMTTMKAGIINLPNESSNVRVFMYGYLTTGNRTHPSYGIEYYRNWGDSVVTEIPVYYTESLFQEFSTSAYLYDDNVGNDYWYYASYGNPITSFEKINADFNYTNISDTNVTINATGDFDLLASFWSFYTDDKSFNWNIYSGSEISEHHLPKLPQSVYDKFPELKTAQFEVGSCSLTDYMGADSHDSFVKQSFGSGKYVSDVFDKNFRRIKFIETGTLAKKTNTQVSLIDTEYLNRR